MSLCLGRWPLYRGQQHCHHDIVHNFRQSSSTYNLFHLIPSSSHETNLQQVSRNIFSSNLIFFSPNQFIACKQKYFFHFTKILSNIICRKVVEFAFLLVHLLFIQAISRIIKQLGALQEESINTVAHSLLILYQSSVGIV